MMKKLISLLTMIVMLLSMTGCDDKEKKPEMDPESAGEFAVDYMKEKYDVAFDLIDFIVPMGKDYAEIRGYIDNNEEVEYIVYACGDDVDKDDDGYADSYTIIGDNYMCTILEPLIKNDMDRLLADKGFGNLDIMTSVSKVWERTSDHKRTGGVSNSFPVCNEQNFDLENIIKSYNMSYYYWIEISESDYTDEFKNKLLSDLGPIFTDDYIICDILIYTDEDFEIVKQARENNEKTDKVYSCINDVYFQLK